MGVVSSHAYAFLDLLLVPGSSSADVASVLSVREASLASDHFLVCCRLRRQYDKLLALASRIEKDRAALSQIYPMPFCRKLVKLIDTFLHNYSRPATSPKQTSLLCDLLDMADLTPEETRKLADWSEREVVAECSLSHVSDCFAVQQQVAPVPVYVAILKPAVVLAET